MRTLNGQNIVNVKNHNRQAILLQLLRTPLSRVELAHKLDLSSTTVTNLINELLAEKWVIPTNADDASFHKSGRGRPRTKLQLNRTARYVLAVHLGIGSYRLGQVDLTGHLIATAAATFPPTQPATTTLNTIATHLQAFINTHNLNHDQLLGLGFGASGLVNHTTGHNTYAPNLDWHNVPIAPFLQEQLNLPVIVENNVRAMALAESYFGHGRDRHSLAFIYGRIGIGAGLVTRGRLARGHHGGAGEIGHTIILPTNGTPCRCGQSGCLETLVTQTTLSQKLRHYPLTATMFTHEDDPIAQFEHILQLARDGDTFILDALTDIAFYLGIALSNLINTTNPQQIILGGMYAQGADIFLPLLRQHIAQKSFGHLGHNLPLETATFGLDTGLVGAATVALLKLFYEDSHTINA
ncbi:MAG TPA: ROK family protein [Anaerolineae bacterium]|nr:ROK family protein [Anaerolineae bacterium]